MEPPSIREVLAGIESRDLLAEFLRREALDVIIAYQASEDRDNVDPGTHVCFVRGKVEELPVLLLSLNAKVYGYCIGEGEDEED